MVPQRLLQLCQSLRVIRQIAGMSPVGENERSCAAEFAFLLHYVLHLEVERVVLGGGQAAFRLVPRYGFELKLGGKSVPAQGQFAQAFQQRQMLGDMLPTLGVARGIAENANAVQLLFLRGPAEQSLQTKGALTLCKIAHSHRELGIKLDACGSGNRPLKKRLAPVDSVL